MIYDRFRVTEVDNNILDLEDLIVVKLNGEDLRRLYGEWDMTLTGIRKMPDDEWLETLFKSQIKGHPGRKDDMSYYNRLEKGHSDRCYTFLLNCVRKYLERQRQDRAKAERTRSHSRTTMPVVGEKKGVCYAFKRGRCNKGKGCPYKHDREGSADPKGKGKGKDKGQGRERSNSPGGRPRICKYYLRG